LANEALTVECLYCRGNLRRGVVPFTLDRRGYHVTWDAVPAWVCAQCGEPLFDAEVVDAMQRTLSALDQQSAILAHAGETGSES